MGVPVGPFHALSHAYLVVGKQKPTYGRVCLTSTLKPAHSTAEPLLPQSWEGAQVQTLVLR